MASKSKRTRKRIRNYVREYQIRIAQGLGSGKRRPSRWQRPGSLAPCCPANSISGYLGILRRERSDGEAIGGCPQPCPCTIRWQFAHSSRRYKLCHFQRVQQAPINVFEVEGKLIAELRDGYCSHPVPASYRATRGTASSSRCDNASERNALDQRTAAFK
jgi:hypothetical protein